MDDIDDDAIARYPSNPYGVGYPNNQGYGNLKHPLRNSSYSHPAANESTRDYDHVDDEDQLGGNDDEDRLGGNDDDVVDEDRLGGNGDDVVDEDRIGGNDDVVDDDDDDDDVDHHSLKQVDEDDDTDGGGDDNDRQSEEYGYLKHSVRNSPYSQPFGNEGNNDEDEDEEDEERLVEEDDDDVDIDQNNNVQLSLKHADEEDSNDEDGDRDENVDDEDGDRDENVDDNDGDNDKKQESYAMMNEDELEWHPKKQKLKSLMSTYEFAARVPTPSAAAAKRSFGVRNSLTEWTEKETFVLLDAWGDRFLQHRRKSLRSEEWQQVAEKVSVVSKVERTGTQCRNRLDTLKKKYKKDKIKFQDMGGGDRKWVYFQKMDKLMSSPPQQARLPCRSNSRERIFMKPGVYVNHANEMDDMKDSPPENTESVRVEGFEGPCPKKRRKGRGSDEFSSFKLLADSIQNFGKIYEKIENNKRQQMMELEKMRMDFLNDLEAQKRQIFERLQSEILKIEQRDD